MSSAPVAALSQFDPLENVHRRFNPLTQTWVLCSPHRNKRPWQGAVEPAAVSLREAYDKDCYLCPGNTRLGGQVTSDYQECFIFENDFAALNDDQVLEPPPKSATDSAMNSLFRVQASRGKCYVICFSPKHNLTIAEMAHDEIMGVIKAWTGLYRDVSRDHAWIQNVQIFENKGAIMGCSNPHPHGQAWSTSYIPTIAAVILKSQKDFALSQLPSPGAPTLTNGKPCLLLTYAHSELSHFGEPDSRIIFKGSDFIAVVPFWASWPFETVILPYKRHIKSLTHLTYDESNDLALIIGAVTRRMDNLFQCSFGYAMGIYQAPVDTSSAPAATSPSAAADDEHWDDYAQMHVGFYPPLLRSSTVRKFIVGFELFAETQRDITPEQAAAKLRACSDVHYKSG